jgi:hypothetical protein
MWIMLNDAFISIVHKDCAAGELLVRARRKGDIEQVFGRRVYVERRTDADYLYRAIVTKTEVKMAMEREVDRVMYGNFKDSVTDPELHHAYLGVWQAMAAVQHPRPYSKPYLVEKPNAKTNRRR